MSMQNRMQFLFSKHDKNTKIVVKIKINNFVRMKHVIKN